MATPALFHILLFEDDIDDCMFFRDALTETGIHTFLKISNRCTELSSQIMVDEKPWPNLIFLDLNLPGVTGQECLQAIRQVPAWDLIPVIIYSTSTLKSEVDKTFDLGANLYLQKPSSFNLLVIAVKRIIQMNWQEKIAARDRNSYLYKHIQDQLIA